MSRLGNRLGNAAVTGGDNPAPDVTTILRAHTVGGTTDTLRAVPVGALSRSPWQPRTEVRDDDDFAALVASIEEHGVLEPLLARELEGGALELLAGERRLQASRAAGRATVPVRVLGGVSDLAARAIALTENLARKDLTAWEEAHAVRLLREARAEAGEPVDVRAMAAAAGRSKSVTAELLRIADALTPAVIAGALELCGRFVRTPDTLPHRSLYAAAQPQSEAERVKGLAMVCGGAAPSLRAAPAATAAPVAAPRFTALGSPKDPRGLRLHRAADALSPADAAEALAALEPLLKALRRRAKGSV